MEKGKSEITEAIAFSDNGESDWPFPCGVIAVLMVAMVVLVIAIL